MLCSLPRAVSCRLCPGEHDCPYIVERPLGRIIVRKREPAPLVQRDLFFVASGSANAPAHRTPYRQAVVAALSWVSVVALILWVVFLHRPAWAQMLAPGVAMLLTFFATIVGVPIVRWLWRDHGGNRKDGPWRPS